MLCSRRPAGHFPRTPSTTVSHRRAERMCAMIQRSLIPRVSVLRGRPSLWPSHGQAVCGQQHPPSQGARGHCSPSTTGSHLTAQHMYARILQIWTVRSTAFDLTRCSSCSNSRARARGGLDSLPRPACLVRLAPSTTTIHQTAQRTYAPLTLTPNVPCSGGCCCYVQLRLPA